MPTPHQLSQILRKEVWPRENETICHFLYEERNFTFLLHPELLSRIEKNPSWLNAEGTLDGTSPWASVSPTHTYSMDAPALGPLNSFVILANTAVIRLYPKKDTEKIFLNIIMVS